MSTSRAPAQSVRCRVVPRYVTTFAWRLAAFYAALFVALGVQVPFLPVWLAAKGLDAREIGIVLAMPMIVRVLAIPLAARAADRHDALRAAIVITAAAAVAGYGAVGLATGPLAIMAAFALASAFYTPMMPLADAYALRGLGRHGPRLWPGAAMGLGCVHRRRARRRRSCSTSLPRAI